MSQRRVGARAGPCRTTLQQAPARRAPGGATPVRHRTTFSVTYGPTTPGIQPLGVPFGLSLPRPPGAGGASPNSVLCGHSSRRRVTADTHQRPTRKFRQLLEPPGRIGPIRNASPALHPHFPPYLVLLRVGFTLPSALRSKRCALTAPFHPYPKDLPCGQSSRRYLFCGTGRL